LSIAPPIASMTGFARAEGGDESLRWAWEVKSVNGRGLDIRCRLPAGLDILEPAVRAAVPERCARGNVTVALTVSRGAAAPRVRVNREVLDQLLQVIAELSDRVEASPPRLDTLLAVRGVVEVIEEDEDETGRAARLERLGVDLGVALDALRAARAAEGACLAELLRGHLDEIERLRAAAAGAAAARPEALKARLRSQLDALLEAAPALPEDRLAQEVAVLVARGDVREELDRLAAHTAAARALLAAGGPIGRRLDFLCQEFNREANTLCAKSADVELTGIGLGLKAAVERLREQVQNIE